MKNNSLVTCSISTIVSIKAVSHTAIRGVFLSLFLAFFSFLFEFITINKYLIRHIECGSLFIIMTWLHSNWIFETTLCDKVCQWLVTGRRFSSDNPISSTNKTDRHNITEILLKVAFNIINPNYKFHRKASISKLFTLKNIPIGLWLMGSTK